MAAIHVEPASDYYDAPLECETYECGAVAEVYVEQTHQDDGESWAFCSYHAVEFVRDTIQWVAHDGEDES